MRSIIATASDRVLARGRFGRQHHRVGAVVDRGGHVRGFGARGHRRADHRFEHLRGDDHRLAQPAAGAHDALLDRRHLLGRHLHAEVAARDHHRVGLGEDRIQALDRRRLLELGDDAGAVPARSRLTSAMSSARCTNDSATQSMPSVRPKSRSAPVLVGQRRQRQHHAGHVDALAVGQHAAVDDAGLGEVGAALLDLAAAAGRRRAAARRPA